MVVTLMWKIGWEKRVRFLATLRTSSSSSAAAKPAPTPKPASACVAKAGPSPSTSSRRALIAELLRGPSEPVDPNDGASETSERPGAVAASASNECRFTLEGLLAFQRSAELLVKGHAKDKVHTTGSHLTVSKIF